jgi:uncharacterized protein (TIGR03067 family)
MIGTFGRAPASLAGKAAHRQAKSLTNLRSPLWSAIGRSRAYRSSYPMKTLIVATILAGSLVTGAEGASDDTNSLEGEWIYESVETQGMPPKKSELFKTAEIKGRKLVFIGAGNLEFTFEIDRNKKPKTIDLLAKDADGNPVRYLGIYELKGDTLRLCHNRSADRTERPSAYDTEKEPISVLVLRRSKK